MSVEIKEGYAGKITFEPNLGTSETLFLFLKSSISTELYIFMSHTVIF